MLDRRVAALAVLLVLVAALAGCSGDDPTLEPSAVGVITTGCGLADGRASGAVVEQSGMVITVAHAVAGADSVVVRDAAGNTHPATVVWFDGDSDIAVLRVPTLRVEPRQLTSASAKDVGTIEVWSEAETIEIKPASVTRRIAVTIEDIYVEDTVQRSGIEIAAAVERGDSGGAVIVDDRVVGMIYANSRARENTGFALDHTEIRQALDSASESVSTGRCV